MTNRERIDQNTELIQEAYVALRHKVLEHYTHDFGGEYSATPSDKPIVVETKDKIMRDNFTVKPVPIYTVTNPKGGTTIIIGD